MDLHSTARRSLAITGACLLVGVLAIGYQRHEDTGVRAATARTGLNEFGEPYGSSVSLPAASGTAVYSASTEAAPVAVQPVIARRQYRYRRRRVVVRRRPFSHSAAIVGGSAAGGALIGGLAGGGKGAAAGALVGGGAGLLYDRLTHKKRVVVRR
jgi:hypothetical protein